jgi:hypothetical protein
MRRRKTGTIGVRAVAASTMVFLLLVATSIPARAEEGETEGSGTAVPAGTCLAGMKWTGGDEGSPEMHPGGNCISCHRSGEGPRFVVAGTVYRKLTEKTDCYGVQGAIVTLTDATGAVVRLTTNKAGNFISRGRGKEHLTMPFTAKVVFHGTERVMETPQSEGNCAGCHISKGANGAPGRIVIPDN